MNTKALQSLLYISPSQKHQVATAHQNSNLRLAECDVMASLRCTNRELDMSESGHSRRIGTPRRLLHVRCRLIATELMRNSNLSRGTDRRHHHFRDLRKGISPLLVPVPVGSHAAEGQE
jgi:hypothetical protein